MKKTRIIISFALMLCTLATASAQNFETAYFLDNYTYGHRFNPAYQNPTNVIGVAIGDIQVMAGSNIGAGTLLYPGPNGGLVSGFHESVSAAKFLGNLKSKNAVLTNVNYNFATVGFWTGDKAYHTIELNVRSTTDGMIPYEMFEFLKKGGYNTTYNINNTDVRTKNYAELAYGYSRKIGDKWTIGARVKLLFGLAAAEMKADNINVVANNGSWDVHSSAFLHMAQPAISIGKDAAGNYDLNTIKWGNGFGLAGFGFGIDLGATFEPIEGLVASLAINDLGGISWKYGINGNAVQTINISSVTNDNADNIGQQFEEIIKFKPQAETKAFEGLPMTVNAGVRYAMPFYRKFSAGLMLTYKNYLNPYFNARLGATITPADWFSFTMNYGIGTYGSSFGSAFSITGGPFNFFAGIETYLGKMASFACIPMNQGKMALNIGITWRFGERHK